MTEAYTTTYDVRGIYNPKTDWFDIVGGPWEWPVRYAYCVTFEDGSEGYWPNWCEIPNRILHMQGDGSYEDVEVTIITWVNDNND